MTNYELEAAVAALTKRVEELERREECWFVHWKTGDHGEYLCYIFAAEPGTKSELLFGRRQYPTVASVIESELNVCDWSDSHGSAGWVTGYRAHVEDEAKEIERIMARVEAAIRGE